MNLSRLVSCAEVTKLVILVKLLFPSFSLLYSTMYPRTIPWVNPCGTGFHVTIKLVELVLYALRLVGGRLGTSDKKRYIFETLHISVMNISIIVQVIIEVCALWLVEGCIISRYYHPARGDYNTEALIYKLKTCYKLKDDVFLSMTQVYSD